MPTHKYQIAVELSLEDAWEKLRDFTAAINYVPGLVEATITTDIKEGVGASRIVRQGPIALNETVTEWREGQGFTLKLHKGDKPMMPFLKDAWFVYGLAERDGKVYLENEMGVEPGMGILGRALLAMGVSKVLAKSLADSTISQKLYYETGKKVTPDMLKAAKVELSGSR